MWDENHVVALDTDSCHRRTSTRTLSFAASCRGPDHCAVMRSLILSVNRVSFKSLGIFPFVFILDLLQLEAPYQKKNDPLLWSLTYDFTAICFSETFLKQYYLLN